MRRFLIAALLVLFAGPWSALDAAVIAGKVGPDGTELQIDLPGSQHMHNTGGSDRKGLCVFTSIAHAGRWQSVPPLDEFQAWMKSRPGGGYPSKVDAMIKAICQEKGSALPLYLNSEGMDLDLLRAATKAGLMPSITYNHSPTGRYNGQHISHMVSLVHADAKWFVILDNNYPGESNYEWLSEAEFKSVYSPGWCVILLDSGPPPVPHNATTEDDVGIRHPLFPNRPWFPRPKPTPKPPTPPAPKHSATAPSDLLGYSWEEFFSPVPNQLKLVRLGVQVGTWRVDTQEYFPLRGDCTWGPPCAPPIPAPPRVYEGGIDVGQIVAGRCTLSGVSVSHADALALLTGGKDLPDNSKQQRITLIGSKADRDRVDLTSYKSAYVVKGYDPTHWAVAGLFVASGTPTIYCQDADGLVRFRSDTPMTAADLAGALRRARPDYDPSKDPDGKPKPPPAPPVLPTPMTPAVDPQPENAPVHDSTTVPATIGGAVLSATALLLLTRRKRP